MESCEFLVLSRCFLISSTLFLIIFLKLLTFFAKLLFGKHLGITNKTKTGSTTKKTSRTIMIAAAAAPPEFLLLELAAGVTFGTVTIGFYVVELVFCVVVFVY